MSENNEFTFENEQYRKTYWHTCSHVLAQACLLYTSDAADDQ